MHKAEHHLIQGVLTLPGSCSFPHFNASQNMQKFKSQIILVEIQANQRQLHNSGKGRPRQPSTACTPESSPAQTRRGGSFTQARITAHQPLVSCHHRNAAHFL